VDRVVGEAEPASRPARLGGDHLALKKALEDLGGGELVPESTVKLGAQVLGGGGQSEVAEVFAEALVGGCLAGHRAASS
jgi:hypothetical protein